MNVHRLSSKQKTGGAIDWEKIKSKVAAMQEIIEQKEVVPPEEKQMLLRKRAAAMAVEENSESVLKERLEVIIFRLAYETYGIETSFVREIYPLKEITVLPGTPPFVLGIMNVRGQILSVIDLKKFFRLPERGLGELNKVIILSNGRMEFGVLADSVEGTELVAREDILTVPVSVVLIGEKYVKGITKDHVVILDAGNIVIDETIIVNDPAIV
jgi:purine-binding chemotaxis protein CheW